MDKLFFSIIKRLNLLFRNKYSIVNRLGCKFIFNKFNWIDNRILSYREYEKKNFSAMCKLQKEYNLQYFFDIGTNFGYFSIRLANLDKFKEIHSFEPLKKNYNQFCGNIFINEFNNLIKPYNFAISDQNTEIDIHYNDKSTGIATLNPEKTERKSNSYKIKEKVICKKLDDLTDLKGKNILMKIDVESHEIQALNGMINFLSNNKIIIFIEANNIKDQVSDLLGKYNYKIISENSEDLVFSNF